MLPPHDEWVSGNSAGAYGSPLDKFLIHTTEGTSIEGAISAYRTNNSWPHMTVDCRLGKKYRRCGHLDLGVAARSLKNKSGGVETNTDGVIQVEIVGSATRPHEIDWVWLARNVIDPICKPLGIPCVSPIQWLPYPNSYGNTSARLSNSEWTNYKGILGHQHAPENDHGDPGLIPIQQILSALSPPPPPPQDWSSDMIAFIAKPDGSRVDLFGIGIDKRILHWSAPDTGSLYAAQVMVVGDGRGETITAAWHGDEIVLVILADGGRPFISRGVEGANWTPWTQSPPGVYLMDAYSR